MNDNTDLVLMICDLLPALKSFQAHVLGQDKKQFTVDALSQCGNEKLRISSDSLNGTVVLSCFATAIER